MHPLPTTERRSDAVLTLLGRILLAALFVPAGIAKIGGFDGPAG